MKNLLTLLLLIGLVPLVLPVHHKYYLIQQGQTWSDAQAYCRAHHVDLATVESSAEMDQLQTEAQTQNVLSAAWIGLYNDVESWHWSYNNELLGSFVNWRSGEPNNVDGHEECGLISSGSWCDVDCTELHPFLCFDDRNSALDRYIYYENPQTWLAAQSYCRQYHTDLASARALTENTVIGVYASSWTWFGLFRDSWKWSDQTDVSTVPWMPGKPDNAQGNENCGSFSNAQVDDDQCSVARPFFCHSVIKGQREILRVTVRSDQDVNNPALMSTILEMIKQKLVEHGLAENITVKWRARPS